MSNECLRQGAQDSLNFFVALQMCFNQSVRVTHMWNLLRDLFIGFWPYILLAAMVAFFFLTILVVGCLEKQRIHDFEPTEADVEKVPSPYFQAMNEAARRMGFQLEGVFAQARQSKTYQCCLAFWLPEDRKTLLCVGGGKLARMNYRKTLLISRLGEKVLVTMDEFGSTDLSGTREIEVLMNADLPELNTRHLQRLALSNEVPASFSTGNPLQQFEDLNRQQVERLVHLGLAKYVNASNSLWSYTIKGAWTYAIRGYLKGFKGAQAQAARSKIKRPGA